MIRDATEDDIPLLLDMGQRFAEKGHIHCGYDRETMAQTFRDLIAAPDGFIIMSECGAIGGLAHPHPFNAGHKTGQELFWWSEDGQGQELFAAMEQRVADLGCDSWSMISLESLRPEAVGAIYRRKGYRLVEHTYVKEL